MASLAPTYRKLRGRSSKMGATCRLWLADDHLLSVRSSGYTEDYKRFFFRDIQAIVISQTFTDKVYSVIFGTICVVCTPLAATQGPGWNIFWGTLFVIFAALLGVNIWRGPTANCKIRTAVQTEELPSLNRLRLAEEVVRQIKPLIEQAQGRLNDEEMPAIVDQMPQVAAPVSATTQITEKLVAYNGRTHEMMFFFLLLSAVFNGIDLAIDAAPLVVFDMTFTMGILISGFLAAIKQHRTNISRPLKQITWISFGLIAVYIYVCFVGTSIMYSIRHPGKISNPSLSDYGVFMGHWVVDLIMIVICAPLGSLGLYFLSEFRTSQKTALLVQAQENKRAEAQAKADALAAQQAQIRPEMPAEPHAAEATAAQVNQEAPRGIAGSEDNPTP
jgi:hypothetical protein